MTATTVTLIAHRIRLCQSWRGFLSLTMVCAVLASVAPAYATPVAYWSFDNHLLDQAGGGHHGALLGVGGAFSADTSAAVSGGGSLDLRAGGYVQVPHDAALNFGTGDFTLAGWVRANTPAQTQNQFPAVFSKRTDTTDGFFLALLNAHASGQGELFLQQSGTNFGPNATNTSLNNDRWHHVAVTRSGTTVTYYTDSVAQQTFASSLSMDSPGPLSIGLDTAAGATTPFKGRLDDLAIWNQALSANEVRGLAYGTRTPLTALPEVTFRDTFNNRQASGVYGTDLGLNQELAGRQTGQESPVSYVRRIGPATHFQVNREDASIPQLAAPGELMLLVNAANIRATAVLNQNFAPDVTLSVRVDPVVSDTASNDWVQFGLRGQGVSPNNAALSSATDAGVVFGIRSNGGWFVNQNGGAFTLSTTPIAWNADGTFDLTLTVLGDEFFATVNGMLLDLNGANPGVAYGLTGLAAGANNFISFGSSFTNDGLGIYSGFKGATLDNLVINAIPEPSGLVLALGLALTVGGVAARRGRKTSR